MVRLVKSDWCQGAFEFGGKLWHTPHIPPRRSTRKRPPKAHPQPTRAELKARWLAQATIEQFLDWLEQTEHSTLTHIEDAVLEFRHQFGQAMAETALQAQETRPPVPGSQCPTAPRRLHRVENGLCLYAYETQVMGDGAKWIWQTVVPEHFSTSRQWVDGYHTKEHLYTVAQSVYGEGMAEAVQWVKEDALESCGRRALIPIRTALLSEQFDEMWSAVYNLPPN